MQRVFIVLLALFLITSILKVDAQSITYSPERGYYDSNQTVTLTTNLAGGIIKYTTNGTLPTPTTGLSYSSPIPVTTTTTIAAIAYSSLDTSGVKSHTYLFLDDVVNQPNSVVGFPTNGFAFDASITGNPTYSAQLDTALKQIPSMCLTLDLGDFNAVHNDTLEKLVSIEIINGDGSNGEQETAGMKRVGTASLNSPKRTFRLNFKSEFGASKLSYSLMGDNAANEFDQIQLRPGFYDVINGGGSNGGNDIYDQFVRNLQEDIQSDNITLHGTFVHLYINGIYWGVYNPTERGTDNFAKKYYDGKKSNWDAMKGGEARSGNDTAWNTLNTFANTQNLTIQANYDSIQKLVEVEQFTDYVLLTNFAPHGNHDPIADNSFATRHRNREDGFRFWVWNTEEPPTGANIYDTGAGPFENIYSALFTNEDYKILLADRLQCNCFDDGSLTPSKTIPAYEEIYNAVQLAYIAEAARWANASQYVVFQNKANTIVNNFLPNRTATTISNYTNAGLLPNLDAVQFTINGGLVSLGTNLTLTNTNGNGAIYYTLDGSDPRLSGGGINPNAMLYSGPISINAIYNINARVYDGSNWSASCPKQFYVPQNYSDLVINEIHYHPNDTVIGNDTIDESDLEFVEIYNNGTTALDLTGVKMTDGGDFNFPAGFMIDTAEFVVIAKDDIRFELFYGLTPNGDYEGDLSNKGEDVVLKDPFNNIIDSVRYDDKDLWDEQADGFGPSLGLIDYDLDNTLASSWDIQKFDVTPFAQNDFCDLGIFCPNIINPASCAANTGIIFCNGSNGSPGPSGYTYLWNTGFTGNGAGGLSDGVYQITAFDSEGCSATETATLNDPVDFQATLTFDPATFVATANVAVGNASDYTYLWSDGTTTQVATNLPAGFNTVSITDASGCNNWLYVEVPERSCQADLTINNPIDESTYQVSDFIISDGQINTRDVEFKAGNYILLLSNFEATNSFNFTAEIDPCQ